MDKNRKGLLRLSYLKWRRDLTILRHKANEECPTSLTNVAKNLLVFALGLFCFLSCAKSESQVTHEEPIAPVHTRIVESSKVGANYAVSGTVTAKKKATLSFRIPGFIRSTHVDRGDYALVGTILAELDPSNYRSDVELAEAELESTRLTLENARADFEKIEGLYKDRTASQKEFEHAENTLKLAETGLIAKRTRLELARRRLGYTKLSSPYDCGIVEKHAQAGEFIDAGRPVVSICSLDPLTVEVGIPDSEITRIRVGDEASISFAAIPSTEFSGSVNSIAPSADFSTRTFPVEIPVDNPDMQIRPGMVAWVELALSTATEAITIPLIAIVRDEDGQPSVYVVNSDTDRAEARRLTVGRAFGTQVEVLDGVSLGEEIIVDGQHQLEVGQKILRVQEGRSTH